MGHASTLFPFIRPNLFRRIKDELRKDFEITRRLSKPIRRATNRRFVFPSPKHTRLRFHNKTSSICFRGIQRKGNSTRHRFSKPNVHPTYEKSRKDRILVELSLSLQRYASFHTISQLLLNHTNCRKTIPCTPRLV